MSHDSSDQIKLLEDVTKIVQSIQLGRYNEKDLFTVDRLHDCNLLYQKAYLHGLSILKLSKGIHVEMPSFNKIVSLNDPVSIALLVRGLLETYLTFYHINFADNNDKRDTSYISWIVFGLKQRQKLKFEKPDESLIHTNRKLYDKYNQMYISNMQRLEEEKRVLDNNVEALKRTAVFSSFDLENQKNYIKQISREWKFGYSNNKYQPIGYQDILNNVGIRISSFSNLYNHLSWPTHSTSVAMSQIADMWNQGRMDILFLNNSLIYTNLFLSLMSRDILINDPDYMIGYNELSQEKKDLMNFYNYYFRGNDFTIDKIY
jgi:uncharacterized protein (UPF0335 family)